MAKKTRNQRRKSPQIKKAAFLAAYAECGTITRAAEIADCDRNAHNYWLEHDRAYPERFAQAERQASDRLEQEARRRAVDGLQKVKFHQGRPIMVQDPNFPNDQSKQIPYVEHEYSDMLLVVLLNANRPDKFRRNVDVTSGGKPIPVKVLQNVSMDEL